MKRYDVCIVGAGAAGLAAAASLDKSIKACIIEKNEVPGRKIMATGGGRCNITNAACAGKDLTLEFFKSLGLETYADEEGRYFPYSNYAPDVVESLMAAVEEKDITVMTDTPVMDISVAAAKQAKRPAQGGASVPENAAKSDREAGGAGFEITCMRNGREEIIRADNVLLAAGGKAAPQFGTTGDGYSLARGLGHSVGRVYPILTAIECSDLSDVKGVRAKCRVVLLKDGSPVAEESGEVQFTADGISGICVFNLTPHIKSEAGEDFRDALKRFSVSLDLAPDFTSEEISGRQNTFGILTKRLAARVKPEEIKGWKLPVKGVKGWKSAQCTAGGVSLAEIDMETMESWLVRGLFFAGEIIDVQGPCGGFNLQNAWETGIRAAATINGRCGR